jgi:excisionase family DNA binding protein
MTDSTTSSSVANLDWLTRNEAAKYLKLGESTMAKLFVSGDGPQAIKIGRAVRYSTADLNSWMLGRRRRSSSDTGHQV